MKRIAWFAGVSTLAVSLCAAPALAGGGDPRIDLAPSTGASESSGGPSYGESISFTLSNARTSKPEVRLVCGSDAAYYPPTQAVLDQTLPYYGSGTREFVLASDKWTGGGNTCVAWMMRKGEPQVGVLFWVTG
ncbi:MAG: hypothetical protein ACJ73L_02495 [Actinomycetes bacterium]